VHFIAYTADGEQFDNTYNRGMPVFFILGAGQVLKGWDAVFPMVSRGQRFVITLPPGWGYGERGYPPIVPPNATTSYEMELMSFSSMGSVERLHREKKAAEMLEWSKQQATR
jgi:FK506-binding protein 1